MKKSIYKSEKITIDTKLPYYDGLYNYSFTTKEELKSKVIEVYKNVMNNSSETYSDKEHSGGLVRQGNGDCVENIVKLIFKGILDINGFNSYIICKGKKDEKKIVSKTGFVKESVDVHVHIFIPKKTISFFTECKTYLAKNFLNTADSDLEHFKQLNEDNKCLVVAFENGICQNSQNYFMDRGNIDEIFYLLDGKRSGDKAIWKKGHFKEMNLDKLSKFISYVEDSIYNLI